MITIFRLCTSSSHPRGDGVGETLPVAANAIDFTALNS
jgi:hypothetical protein